MDGRAPAPGPARRRSPAAPGSLAIFVALVLAGCGPPPQQVTLVVAGATIIDPRGDAVLERHSVFIEGDRIVGIEPTDGAGGFVAADTIDAAGRFVIPGLLDMHAHLFRRDVVASRTLDLMLANGITGFREMASDCWDPDAEGAVCIDDLRELARGVAAGERAAPRPLSVASAPVNGVAQREGLPEGAPPFLAPETEEEGRELAAWLADRGVDVVKVYNSVPRAAYFGLTAAAGDLGLEVSGHLPLGVSVVEASRAGHRTIEHARDLPVACSRYGAEYRPLMARVVEGRDGTVAPSTATRIRSVLESFDEGLCREVFETLVANDTYLVPTHGTREMDARAGEQMYRSDERMRYMLRPIRDSWNADLDRTARATPEVVELYREFYALGLRLSGMAHAAGVKVMAGTDANDTMIFPGSGLHDELARLAEGGIPPMDVLRAATSLPAEYLGAVGEVGTVSVGARADLLLLGRDPLVDIENTRTIEAVILGGELFDRARLDAILERVEATAEEEIDPSP